MNLKNKMAMRLDLLDFLKKKGKEIQEIFNDNVIKISDGNNSTLVKFDRSFDYLFQAKRENEIYEKYGNLEGLPKKIAFYENVTNSPGGYNNYILEKEFIEGDILYLGTKIEKKEKEKMLELIEFFYHQGYLWLDLKPKNFILTPEKKLYLIDFGGFIKDEDNPDRELLEEHILEDAEFLYRFLKGDL